MYEVGNSKVLQNRGGTRLRLFLICEEGVMSICAGSCPSFLLPLGCQTCSERAAAPGCGMHFSLDKCSLWFAQRLLFYAQLKS